MKRVNMLDGPILGTLLKISLPIVASSVIQLGYNLIDMLWIGRLGSNAVAAIGAAGMYLWMGSSLTTIPRIGGQVLTGQKLGESDRDGAAGYALSSLRIALVIGLAFGILNVLFDGPLIRFYQLTADETNQMASQYHMITCGLIVFSVVSQVLGGIFTAMGNTIINFRATVSGLVINLVLDPLLIFGVGPFPELGVIGAALATVIAQIAVFFIYTVAAGRDQHLFPYVKLFSHAPAGSVKKIITIGFPPALQDCIFSGISMIISRIVAGWGDGAVAAQKVGTQIESISWTIASGLTTALNAFTAQNFGAGNLPRIHKGFKTGSKMMIVWGIIVSAILIIFPEPLFRLFITEEDVIPIGVAYLQAVGAAELFSCMEGLSAGILQGMGHTLPSAISGVSCTLLRIPLALILSATSLGIYGVWWTISISMMLKGLILTIWLVLFMRKQNKALSADGLAKA